MVLARWLKLPGCSVCSENLRRAMHRLLGYRRYQLICGGFSTLCCRQFTVPVSLKFMLCSAVGLRLLAFVLLVVIFLGILIYFPTGFRFHPGWRWNFSIVTTNSCHYYVTTLRFSGNESKHFASVASRCHDICFCYVSSSIIMLIFVPDPCFYRMQYMLLLHCYCLFSRLIVLVPL